MSDTVQFTLRDIEPELFCSGNFCGNLAFDCVVSYQPAYDEWEVIDWRFRNGKTLDDRAGTLERILGEKLREYAAKDCYFRALVERHLPYVDENKEHRLTVRDVL